MSDLSNVGIVGGLGPERITEQELINSSADVFAPPLLDKTHVFNRECVYRPMQTLDQVGPLTFTIPGEAGLYIDPNTIRIVGKFIVEKSNAQNQWEKMTEAAAANEKCSIINLIGSSLFSGIACTMNATNVSFVESTNTHYKAYLQNICTYGQDAAKTHMKAAGFVLDDGVDLDSLDAKGNSDRRKWIHKSGVVSFSSFVHCDILETDRILPDNMGMSLSFTRASDDFVLLTDDASKGKYRLVLQDLELRVHKVQLNHDVHLSIERDLANGKRFRYPIVRSQIKVLNVAQGSSSFTWSNAILGRMPFMVLTCMVENESYTGAMNKNPFNFKAFGVNDFWYTKNNYDLPVGHYKPDFSSSHSHMRDYRIVCDMLHGRSNAGMQITPELFKNGYTVFPMDFTPDKCSGYHRHDMGTGSLTVNATFGAALTKAVTVILYAAYYDEYQIDATRTVYAVTEDTAQPQG